jgi:hypothetical protein
LLLDGGSCDLPDTSELYAEAPPSIPSDLFCRKMLPVADLDYELEALGTNGVAGSGTDLFLRSAAGSPRRPQHIRDKNGSSPLDHSP